VPAVYIGRGEAVFEFYLPEAIRDLRLDRLVLSLRSEGGWRQAPSVALYDWRDESWIALSNPTFGDNPVADTEAFVSADDVVRVRLAVDGASGGSCYVVGVGVEGERGGEQ
jgi:hypothetical protein